MDAIDRLGGYSNYGICSTGCAADENALVSTENDPAEGELWSF